LIVLLLFACQLPLEGKPFNVGFLYDGQINDFGWNYQLELGRIALAESFLSQGIDMTSTFLENETKLDVIENFTYPLDLLIVTSLNDLMLKVLQTFPKKYPEKYFVSVIWGQNKDRNTALMLPKLYQTRYLTGLMCGNLTKTNKVGYILPLNYTGITRDLDAFYIGVTEANPKAEVYYIIVNTFYEPVRSQIAADILLDMSVDCLAGQQNDATFERAAQKRGAWTIGYSSDMRFIVGEWVATSVLSNWDNFLIELGMLAYNKTWDGPYDFFWGLEKQATSLAWYSTLTPNYLIARINSRRKELAVTDDIFCGPLVEYLCTYLPRVNRNSFFAVKFFSIRKTCKYSG